MEIKRLEIWNARFLKIQKSTSATAVLQLPYRKKHVQDGTTRPIRSMSLATDAVSDHSRNTLWII